MMEMMKLASIFNPHQKSERNDQSIYYESHPEPGKE